MRPSQSANSVAGRAISIAAGIIGVFAFAAGCGGSPPAIPPVPASFPPQAVAAVAPGMAGYLVQVETQRVQAQTAHLSRTAARDAAQAQQRWLEAQAHYYVVCGCIAGQTHATVDPATLALLRFALGRLRATYLAAAARSTALQTNTVPVALVTPGAGGPLTTNYPPSIEALLPAAVLGFLLSSGLAALLDHRRSRAPARGGVRAAGWAGPP